MYKQKAPAWSFSVEPRSPERKTGVPGPGSYSPQSRRQSPQFSMGLSKRTTFGLDTPSMPGPGTYTVKLSTVTGHPFSKGLRMINPRDLTPGPGAYNIKQRAGGPAFTLQSRLGGARQRLMPGPGQYYYSKGSYSPRWGFAKDERDRTRNTGVPGPGSYEVPLRRRGPSFQFPYEPRKQPEIEESPGPGAYTVLL